MDLCLQVAERPVKSLKQAVFQNGIDPLSPGCRKASDDAETGCNALLRLLPKLLIPTLQFFHSEGFSATLHKNILTHHNTMEITVNSFYMTRNFTIFWDDLVI